MGDPYEEKRLIEACLELLDAKLVVGIQDLGGAGLVCATSETAARGGVGMDVDVSAVPRREPGMAPYEVMTSESQERMLAIVTPDDLAEVEEVCRRWEVRSAVVGRVTEPPAGELGRLRMLDGFDGRCSATSPPSPSARTPRSTTGRWPVPATTRPGRPTTPACLPAPADCGADVCALLSDPSWVYRQYDHQLFLNTVDGPGGDAAVLRLAAPGPAASERGLALTTDSNPDLVPDRSAGRHGGHGGRGRPQRGLRRGPARGRGQLPQLRQSRAPRGDVAAVGGGRRDERGLSWPSACRSSAAT